MENETLKQLVLAKGKEVWNNETNDPKASGFRVHSNDGKHLDVHNYRRTVHCKLSDDLTAEDNAWVIAADLLDIPTEMSIDEFEQDLTNRQYVHDLRQAFDAGGDWGFAKANGAKVHSDVAFNQFMEKEPTTPEPVPFFDSQLRELCVALGWQGGTYHQVLAEIKRLKTFADEKRTESHC